MWGVLAAAGGWIVLVVGVAWWIRRRSKEVDGYHEREYREPPTFQWPDMP
jgi:hypothetical protein